MLKVERKPFVLGTVLCLAAVVLCQRGPGQRSMPSPRAIFDEAHALSTNLNPDDRAVVLFQIATGAQKIDAAACRAWSRELFDVARRLMLSGNSRATQKNALVVLSSVDPKLSAQLFRQQDLPDSDHETYEDNRVYAAGPVFSGLWRIEKRKSFGTVRNLANWMGATGQYPYQAVGEMILELYNNGYKESAQTLFSDAEYAYAGTSAGFRDTNSFFVDFLLTAYRAANHALLEKGLTDAVDGLKRASEKDKHDIQVQIQNKSVAHSFSSETDALLYRLLPLLKNTDPDFADSVLRERKDLASESPSQIGDNGRWHGVAVGDQPAQKDINSAFDRQTVDDVLAAKQDDPRRAVLLSSSIVTPELRDLAVASVLPGYIAVEPNDGKRRLGDIEKQLESMSPDKRKLELEIALVGTYFDLKRDTDANALARKAFDLGTELVAQDMLAHPGQYMFTANGTRELLNLANLLGKKDPQPLATWQTIEQVQDDGLRAQLLASFGRGLLTRNSPIPTEPEKHLTATSGMRPAVVSK